MRTEEKLSQLSDEEILQGFIGFDTPIIREYFYGYCRVAYCIYDKKYNLKNKPGMTSSPWLTNTFCISETTTSSP